MAYSNSARIELTGESAELERRLSPITAELNEHPLRVNKETWLRNLESAEEDKFCLIDYCRLLSEGDDFRPNSTADCARVLFTDRGVKGKTSKESGRVLTDRDTLLELANGGDKLAGAIVEARSSIVRWSQLRKWKPFALAGIVQSTWDSNGQPHGRYTSALPCLCNRILPIRETIEPDPGYSFLSVDLNQAEYVTWASLSGDLVLGEAFVEGKDFHKEMAQAIKEAVPFWDLRGQEPRAAGKTINFALLYQMQPSTLSRKLGCSQEIAQRITDAYQERAATATKYIRLVLRAARKAGYVSTYFGRRRYCPELQNSNGDAHAIEKTLWSHHNAGTAAEFLKFKQAEAWEALRREGYGQADVRLSLQMYDECVWMVSDRVLTEVRQIIEEVWMRKVQGFLPFRSEAKVGKSWKEVS